MDYCAVTRKCLIFLAVNVHLASAATHSLHYFYTAVTSGINIPEFTIVGLVDGQQHMYYDSNIRKLIPKTDWMDRIDAHDTDYWKRETQKATSSQTTFKASMDILMDRFNHTKGVHTVQVMYGCELNDDGTKKGYRQEGYDGEDFLSLDLNTVTYIAANQKAVITKQKLDVINAVYHKAYLENTCIEWLKKYVGYGRSSLERKVSPKVDLFQKDSSSPVVCHATGFFPKSVMIYWQKNGEDMEENVEIRETLPNQDGTFQKRSILTVSPEELNQYTCVVQHSSLEKEMRLSEPRVLSGVSGRGYLRVISAAILFTLGVILGVFIWKRKKSDFKLVSGDPKSPSGEHSLCNNAKRPPPSC